jgi:uncharacterized LabA/DUF88 family protein
MPQLSAILIDGSNFYFKLKDLGLDNQLNFNFRKFTKRIALKCKNVSTTYYIGAVRTKSDFHTRKLHAKQQKLFQYLSSQDIKYSLGYLLESNGVVHEKGVDIQIAVDMLIGSYENKIDRIILISSDTDLIPAIKQVQKLGKYVTYVGFKHKPSRALINVCSDYVLLSRKDLEVFYLL